VRLNRSPISAAAIPDTCSGGGLFRRE